MRVSLVVPPAEEPLSLADAKLHLRVDTADTAQDTVITSLAKAAREYAELVTRRAFVTQTWSAALDAFPACGEIELPLPPLQSVTSVSYVDADGVLQVMPSADYVVDTSGLVGRVYLAYDKSWPAIRSQPRAVTVTFVAGYGVAAAVPEAIRAAIKLITASLFENREEVITGTIATRLPFAADSLLWSYRVLASPAELVEIEW